MALYKYSSYPILSCHLWLPHSFNLSLKITSFANPSHHKLFSSIWTDPINYYLDHFSLAILLVFLVLFIIFFRFLVPSGILSWLPTNLWVHFNIWYHILSYHIKQKSRNMSREATSKQTQKASSSLVEEWQLESSSINDKTSLPIVNVHSASDRLWWTWLSVCTRWPPATFHFSCFNSSWISFNNSSKNSCESFNTSEHVGCHEVHSSSQTRIKLF